MKKAFYGYFHFNFVTAKIYCFITGNLLFNIIESEFDHLVRNIFLFIIRLQVAYIYFDSLYDKLHVKEWRNGMMINYWFNDNFFGLHPKLIGLAGAVLKSSPVLIFIAWGTMLLEAVMVTGLLFPQRFKLVLLKIGIAFHLSIMLIHGFASFFFAMSAALFLYLYPYTKRFTLNLLLNEK